MSLTQKGGGIFKEGDFITENLKNALSHLKRNNKKLVLTNGNAIFSSNVPGVFSLLELIDENEFEFSRFSAADKVIGKGAAFLYAKMKIKEVYGLVISEKAKEIFDRYKIPYYYDTLVPFIINRKGDGMCPVEKSVENITEAETAYSVIMKTVNYRPRAEKSYRKKAFASIIKK